MRKMLPNRRILIAVAAVVTVILVAPGTWLLSGQRYRLYTDPQARACRDALVFVTASPAATQLRRISPQTRTDQSLVSITIDFELTNVFAGSMAGVIECHFGASARPADRRAIAIFVNGEAIDSDLLDDVNRSLTGQL